MQRDDRDSLLWSGSLLFDEMLCPLVMMMQLTFNFDSSFPFSTIFVVIFLAAAASYASDDDD